MQMKEISLEAYNTIINGYNDLIEKQRSEISSLQSEVERLKKEKEENYELAKWWTDAWNNLNKRYEHLKATGKDLDFEPVAEEKKESPCCDFCGLQSHKSENCSSKTL